MFVQQISAFTLSTWKGIMFLFILLLLHQIRYASNHLVWQMVDTVFGKLCLHMSTSLSCLYIKWYEGSTWGHWFTGNFIGRMLAYNWCLTEQEKRWSTQVWHVSDLLVCGNHTFYLLFRICHQDLVKWEGRNLLTFFTCFWCLNIHVYAGYLTSISTTILGINLKTMWMCIENYLIIYLKEIILSNS